jgi:hopanoid biosynthesis associated RND transporter like protein HpnN
LNLNNMAGWMGSAAAGAAPAERQQAMAAVQDQLGRLCEGLAAALGEPARYQSPWPDMAAANTTLSELGSGHLLENDGRVGFVLLRLTKDDKESFAQNSEAIDTLHRLVAQARARHPEVKIGLTGLPVIENDEMRSSQSSMSLATILAFAGVLAVLVIAFGGLRHSFMAMGALVIGMIWACGCITLTVGHVTILSIAFGSILLGLGIDYGVYYVARYLQLREAARSTREAIVETAATVGPGITTGAFTSAIAFFAIGFTDFLGVAQLGLIAGGGVLLCWLAQMTVLPAMIQLTDTKGLGQNMPIPLDLNRYLRPALFTKPRLVLAATLAGTAVLALGLRYLWYDYNLLRLQQVGLESVELEQKLCNEMNRSAYFALSIAESPQELLSRKAQFLALPTVERVEDLGPLFPPDVEQKRPIVQRIRGRLANLPSSAPPLPVAPAADLERMLCGAQMMLGGAPGTSGTPATAQLAGQLAQIRDLLRRLAPAEYQQRMSGYQQAVATDLLGRLHTLRASANPEPPKLSDLPEGLVTRYVGKHGRFLQKVYSRVDIWDMDRMKQFAQQVRSVDPQVTGNPLQVYEASRQMKRSFEQAAWYALMAIVPVVLFDYRRLSHTLLAILPMGVGMVQTFGLLGALDIALNPANMIVLPLVLGIGIESGVNIVHDFRNQGKDYRRISNSTTVAVVVNSLTSMVGFGALMIANHRGVQSLGRVMTIAMGCCLFSSLVLPNLLLLYRRAKNARDARNQEAEESPYSSPLPLPALEPKRYAA